MKQIKYLIIVAAAALFATGCNKWLDVQPETIITDDMIFGDQVMIESVLANLYDRSKGWDHLLTDAGEDGERIDEYVNNKDARNWTSIPRNMWRDYPYEYLRHVNQFISGLRSTTIINETVKKPFEGEARFLRAYAYFIMARSLGGVPIIGDSVFKYTVGMDVTTLQIARSTEAATYDYIISELDAAAAMMNENPSKNASRATKWTALGLKARAAIYAGSIAKRTALMTVVDPSELRTPGFEAGIPADQADRFYQTALDAAEAVIGSGKYSLMKASAGATQAQLSRNFYEMTSVKNNNTEILWSYDRFDPGVVTGWTKENVPFTHKEDIDAAIRSPVLNIVEDYEYISNRNGLLVGYVTGDGSNPTAGQTPTMFAKITDIFADKDPRCGGTVILPGTNYKQGSNDQVVPGQAGLYLWDNANSKYVWFRGNGTQMGVIQNMNDYPQYGYTDSQVTVLSYNGPFIENTMDFCGTTGFFFRKFMDENLNASTRGRESAMWNLRMRLGEMYLIAAEALVEGNVTSGAGKTAADYINEIRGRAGIDALSSVTFDDIVRENRNEFNFERHRYWDVRRWRIADQIWDGDPTNPKAVMYTLLPFKVYRPGHADDGKWVFWKRKSDKAINPKLFNVANYYAEYDQGWRNKNPKLVQNPYQ